MSYPVYHVPSIVVDRLRQNATHPEKSDALDAEGVAQALVLHSSKLLAYTVSEADEKAKRLKDLASDRTALVLERTRLKNQIHTLLYRIYNTEYQTKYKDPFALKALRYWSKAKPKCDPFLLKTMKRKVRRIQAINAEIAELETDMSTFLSADDYTIHTAPGCGVVIAATIIGEIGDISKFASPGALAKYAGCAPREFSSGKKLRHRKTRAGNRTLKEYFKKKVAEGKSKSQALVCLRRQLVTIVWMMLKHNTVYRTS